MNGHGVVGVRLTLIRLADYAASQRESRRPSLHNSDDVLPASISQTEMTTCKVARNPDARYAAKSAA